MSFEGLLPTVTLALAMGLTRMTKRHALVKDLPRWRLWGGLPLFAATKRGPLIENTVAVHHICVDGHVVEVSATGYQPKGRVLNARRALCGRRLRQDFLTLV
jgi:P-type Ca2+ transporter type 2C